MVRPNGETSPEVPGRATRSCGRLFVEATVAPMVEPDPLSGDRGLGLILDLEIGYA